MSRANYDYSLIQLLLAPCAGVTATRIQDGCKSKAARNGIETAFKLSRRTSQGPKDAAGV